MIPNGKKWIKYYQGVMMQQVKNIFERTFLVKIYDLPGNMAHAWMEVS
jgi:hypothetical protein